MTLQSDSRAKKTDGPLQNRGESARPSGHFHFLLVEDNPLDAELVRSELRRAGFDFTFATVQTPDDFTREVRTHCPDIVLADYSLPQWSGMEALEILVQEGLNVPLILVSGMLGEETAVDCIKKGATDYVLKRALARLPVAIRRALQEKELRARNKLAEELFRRAVESSPSGILMTDESGTIVLANAKTEKLFGYKCEEMVGQSIEMLVPGRVREVHREHRAAYRDAPAGRELGHSRDLACLHKDGTEFPAEVGLNPVQTSTGMRILIAVVDLTARKAGERKAEEHTRELQRSNEELEQFAYIAAHDLQEPLRMVVSYTELLRERYQGKLDEKAAKYIGYAVDGAQRMQRLLNDLLDYSRVGTRQKALRATDTEAVLTSVLRGLQKAVEANHAVIVREKLPEVLADEVQLGQVLQNLIGNALKFHGKHAPQIRVSAETAEKMVRFAVADNGIGMEKESSGRIFQMFQRLHTREEYEGSGIGLAIVKKIVERHGGKIWFDSVAGEGTTFYFTIQATTKEGEVERAYSRAAGGG
jgi:PAS domain S-box-containing protein